MFNLILSVNCICTMIMKMPVLFRSSLSIASFDGEDLHPYISHHGPTHGNRFVRDCQNVRYGNMTHSKHKAHVSDHITLPVVHTSIVIPEVGLFDKRDVLMHHHVISNPLQTFSVLEPLEDGACQNDSVPRATVMDSARRRQCLVAANGGYFNTHNGECYGMCTCLDVYLDVVS